MHRSCERIRLRLRLACGRCCAPKLGGYKFRRQYLIGHRIADSVCLPARLVVEVDGDSHGNDEIEREDAERSLDLAAMGYRVIRFCDSDVLDSESEVADAILGALARAKRAS